MMSDDLLERLNNEADLCRNDGADDCAKLFDAAITRITELEARPAIATVDLRDRVARAIDYAYVGYSICLTGLVDGVSEYTAHCSSETRVFESHRDASEWVEGFRLNAKADAAILALTTHSAEVAA